MSAPTPRREHLLNGSSFNPSPEAALKAIVARINGIWDDPDLAAYGPLRATQDDVLAIAQAGLVEAASMKGVASTMLHALSTAAHALDRLSHGADFDRVVEETGVTHQVLTAIRDAQGTASQVATQHGGTPDTAPAQAEGLTAEQKQEATKQGWNLFASEGELQIQCLDEQGAFDDDGPAWLFVIREAARNPASAAAKALSLVQQRSPAEYHLIEQFDRENERLLPYQPKTTAGHPVDLAEVAEWVGLHYRKTFGAAGMRQQEWIDRFAVAHSHEERFAAYLVAEHWGHIFFGKSESTTRWVFRLGGDDEGVVCAQILGPLGQWTDLDHVAMKDLEESIYDNSVPDTYREAWASEVRETLQRPSWAPAAQRLADASSTGDAQPAERLRG